MPNDPMNKPPRSEEAKGSRTVPPTPDRVRKIIDSELARVARAEAEIADSRERIAKLEATLARIEAGAP